MAASSALSRFFALFNPIRASRDFLDVWMQENPYRWRIMAVSAAATFSIFSVMFQEEGRIEPRAPDVTYITVLDPTRTREQIEASNIANQKLKDERREDENARRAQVRGIYEALGRATGMDVEEARRRGEAERAAQSKAEEEARRRALERVEQR